MWGTHSVVGFVVVRNRFIPTHVGNTLKIHIIRYILTVHPHACGEHVVVADIVPRFSGSSPRMWGTLDKIEGDGNLNRFIPTHVGNTLNSETTTEKSAVHPHACGEHYGEIFPVRSNAGSSPRMWGTHFL